jgi:hypothetical protein
MGKLVAAIRSRIALFLVCILGVAGISALILSSQNGDRHQEPPAHQQGQGSWQVSLVHRGITEMSEGRGSGSEPLSAYFGQKEPMPSMLRKRISRNLGGVSALHLRFTQAQHVNSSLGPSFWIVEGRGVTCLFRDGMPASSCRTSVSAREEGIWLGTYSTRNGEPGRPVNFLAMGVVPRAIGSVVAHTGPSKGTVRVRRHIWALRSRFPIEVNTSLNVLHGRGCRESQRRRCSV